MIYMPRKTFPCPYCKGKWVVCDGDYVDVGIGMVQVSADETCVFCDEGFVTIGSEKHHDIQFFSWWQKAPLFLFPDEPEAYNNQQVLDKIRDYLLKEDCI